MPRGIPERFLRAREYDLLHFIPWCKLAYFLALCCGILAGDLCIRYDKSDALFFGGAKVFWFKDLPRTHVAETHKLCKDKLYTPIGCFGENRLQIWKKKGKKAGLARKGNTEKKNNPNMGKTPFASDVSIAPYYKQWRFAKKCWIPVSRRFWQIYLCRMAFPAERIC